MIVFQDPGDEYTEIIELEGHLIDSYILPKVFDRVMDLGGEFEVLDFRIGRRKDETSYARIMVKGRSRDHLEYILKELRSLGALPVYIEDAKLEEAPDDMVLPDGFYATTNHPTWIRYNGRWVQVEDVCMDKVIVVDPVAGRAYCKGIRDVRRGDLVVVGDEGVRVKLPEYPRTGVGIFEFMSSRASPEKPTPTIVKRIAEEMYKVKASRGRIVVVAGPAVVHTGGGEHLARMIRMGFVDALLSGNALAVHDVEYALFGTSLGFKVDEGYRIPGGNKNHLVAINEVMKCGGLRRAVEKGILKKGIFYECIVNDVPYVLAGSIRDDGPIPDVITDVVEAQKAYRMHLKDAGLVLMLASMLHSIAVGNMIPSTVKVVCVDINPAVPVKLLDRGAAQSIGVVSDVGVFLPMLVDELAKLKALHGSPKKGDTYREQ
ncbi:MAG: TIGR00300 family protein [Nitrososphaerota archaeon]|nr:TIGR00300 family protein [Candidatus Bathyarchaeota archaeon]MCX8162562.1 TIGR00300 family protein [Candidatus Bathyarchaeota archaeon]MDW8062196.1 TIGR00300 family protein [Nitrososphaerota archaeon]